MLRLAENFHKKAIAEQFNKAAVDYHKNANLQLTVGKKLLANLTQNVTNVASILDLGCGPGSCTKTLKQLFPSATYIAIDLADKMLALNHNIDHQWRVLSDFDILPIGKESIDLIFSNMALQWSLNIKTTLSEWRETLAPNGLLAFSTIGNKSFSELNVCNNTLAQKINVNHFYTLPQLQKIIADLGLQSVYFTSEIITLYFADFFSLLKHFKKIGANYVFRRKQKNLATKHDFLEAEKNFQKIYNVHNRFPLSYEIIYCVLRKNL